MPQFLAVTSRGLTEPLAAELTELGIRRLHARSDVVEVDCSWQDLYKLHGQTRLASRFLLPVCDFTAYNEQDLYYGVLRNHDFTKYIDLKQTFRVEARARDHRQLRDQRFVAMRVKDAIADQFRAKFGERPNVGADDSADLRVVVRVVGPKISLSIDLTGETLSNHGYRIVSGAAPLRESVAAGILRLVDWQPEQNLIDPFCGTGTILIEAAQKAAGLLPGRKRRTYAYSKLKNFSGTEGETKPDVRKAPPKSTTMFGFDRDPSAIRAARSNADAAGVAHWIRWQVKDVRELTLPNDLQPGKIVTNPPYGERIADASVVKALMNDFSHTLKTQFKGWDAWILSGRPEMSQGLHLKSSRTIPLWNGPIECRLLKYELR